MGKSTDALRKGHAHNGGREDPDKIQHDIDMTRAEMDETVNELQNRLSPQQIVAHALDALRDSVREGTPRMMSAIKHNPVPSSLIALGIGWLLLKSSRRSEEYDIEYVTDEEMAEMGEGLEGEIGEKLEEWQEEASSGMERAREKTGEFYESARERSSRMAEKAREKASRMKGRVRERAQDLAERARRRTRDLAEGAKEKSSDIAARVKEKTSDVAGNLGSLAAEKTRRARGGVVHMYEDNPVAFAGLALAIGAAVGFAIPRTRKESEMMGETRDTLLRKARETGQETIEKVQQVAEAAGEAAKQEAARQDLMP